MTTLHRGPRNSHPLNAVIARRHAELDAQLDHIVPMARGGHHVAENLQCACLRCNVTKGARSANDQLRLPT